MLKVLIIFIYLIGVSFEYSSKSAQKYNGDAASNRLPNTTMPQLYSIKLTFREDVSFLGTVSIKIKVLENTNVITIHSSVLILSTFLTKSDINGTALAHTHDIDVEREFLLIKTTEEILQKDSILWLTIKYIGYISASNEGIFRKSFAKPNGDLSNYIATRTKPNFARRIFPSYDEPRFKAQFVISLNHSAQFKAISNIEEHESDDDLNGRKITIFNHTRYIPTYLIAFVISDFQWIGHISSTNVLLRTFTNQVEIQNIMFGLETTDQALDMFQNIFSFEVQHEIYKIDQVVLPSFDECSVASYGIAFYQENCFLFDPLVNTIKEKESAALSAVNNVCHQVLENHFTPYWWSTQWLFEGLCRFYEYSMTSKFYPELVSEGLFSAEITESALVYDSLSTTHSLSHYEESPNGVRDLHDTITYNKSASILRMIYHSLSEETFNKGISIFLSKSILNSFDVTIPKDLYDAWQSAANEDNVALGGFKVEELFNSWENQEGYPILYVERSYNNHHVRFNQKPFTVSSRKSSNYLWFIPITYTSKFDYEYSLQPKVWLEKQKSLEILIDELHPSSYFLVNVERMGYYRVQYDEANWMLISKELSLMDPSSNISPASRAMLMNDATVFLSRNMLRARIFLELMKHLEHDDEYIPWLVATRSLHYMRLMVMNGNSKLSDDFKRFLQKLLLKVFSTYGIEEQPIEPDYHKHIRNIAISWSCGVHLQSCLDATRDKLWKFMLDDRNISSISVDHEHEIFCKGLIMITEHEFDFIWKKFKATKNPARRNLYLNSMGCIEDESILMKFLMMIIERKDIDNVENMEWKTILKSTYSNNVVGLRVTLYFLRQHYDAFIELLQELNSLSTMNEILRDISNRINDRNLAAILSDLLVIYNVNEDVNEEIHAVINDNLLWLNTHSSDIQEFLNDFHSSALLSSRSTVLVWYFVVILVGYLY